VSLKILIENPGLRAKVGARGREIVVSEFAVEKVVLETMKVYGELLKQ
jgi:glycosyltransferase involved in cell wall biosynthesis